MSWNVHAEHTYVADLFRENPTGTYLKSNDLFEAAGCWFLALLVLQYRIAQGQWPMDIRWSNSRGWMEDRFQNSMEDEQAIMANMTTRKRDGVLARKV